MTAFADNPHIARPARQLGAPVTRGGRALILLHGRGQTPEWIKAAVWDRLGLDDWTCLIPEADQSTWYPERFLVPESQNQPRLSQALECIMRLSDDLAAQGIPYASQVIAGFSQGGCLASEFVWRRRRAYGGVLVFTGTLLDEQPHVRDAGGLDFHGMPVLFSTWDEDPHVPLDYVLASAESMQGAGAHVQTWSGMGTEHGIQDAEIALAVQLLKGVAQGRTQQGEQ